MEFVDNYIEYKVQRINNNRLMTDEYKKEKTDALYRILRVFKMGLVTVDETMKSIADI